MGQFLTSTPPMTASPVNTSRRLLPGSTGDFLAQPDWRGVGLRARAGGWRARPGFDNPACPSQEQQIGEEQQQKERAQNGTTGAGVRRAMVANYMQKARLPRGSRAHL